MEGVHPGSIQLEWRLQKGAFDVTFDQEIEIYTRKSANSWRLDLNYKIRLETSNDPSGQVRTLDYPLISDGYRPNLERACEFYDFYRECFNDPLRSYPGTSHLHAMSWAGLARLAGSQVIGGLSDSEYARNAVQYGVWLNPKLALANLVIFDNWTVQEILQLQTALFEGGWRIFSSVGWQHHAFRNSGTQALQHVIDTYSDEDASFLMLAWLELRQGILDQDNSLIESAARRITDREQNVTIVPTWQVIDGLFFGMADYMFTILGTNSCTPSGIDFSDLYPLLSGNLANTADRWNWIDPATSGGILQTWNSEPLVRKLTLARLPLNIDAERFSWLSSHITTAVPVLCWDDEDIP
jgi:hypothetical protein